MTAPGAEVDFADGAAVPTVEFDWDQVEAASGLWMDRFAQAGLTRATAEALAREFGPPPSNEPGPPNTDALPVAFMAVLYSIFRGVPGGDERMRSAFENFCAFAYLMTPGLLGCDSVRSAALACGIGRMTFARRCAEYSAELRHPILGGIPEAYRLLLDAAQCSSARRAVAGRRSPALSVQTQNSIQNQ